MTGSVLAENGGGFWIAVGVGIVLALVIAASLFVEWRARREPRRGGTVDLTGKGKRDE